ncbi:MAG TPA: Rrf2 family transcriptional regulator [bacterium]|nr:Rrf2 family transcriptional regulator [bacterium]
MLLKRETEYAIRGLIALARFDGEFCDIGALAREEKLPSLLLSKLFQKLKKTGLVRPKIGSKGGFCLSRDADKITLLSIIQSIQSFSVIDCMEDGEGFCKKSGCTLRPVIEKINQNLVEQTRVVSLKDLI